MYQYNIYEYVHVYIYTNIISLIISLRSDTTLGHYAYSFLYLLRKLVKWKMVFSFHINVSLTEVTLSFSTLYSGFFAFNLPPLPCKTNDIHHFFNVLNLSIHIQTPTLSFKRDKIEAPLSSIQLYDTSKKEF